MSFSLSPNVRFGIFLAAGAFFLLGPIETQVFLGPARSAKRPYLPMHWHMYHSVGVNFCQAHVFAERDGTRYDYPKDEVSRAVGKGSPRSKKRNERFAVGKKARTNDVMLGSEGELADVVRPLCATDPDVRAEMRCSPGLPGGSWRAVEDGSANLCARTKWKAATPAVTPTLDVETGEPTEEVEPQE